MVEFAVLGPVGVRRSGQAAVLPVGQPVRVLAMLIAVADDGITLDTIIDGLWPGPMPKTARKTVQVYIHLLRRALGTGAIHYAQGRYRLAPARVDAAEFRAACADAAAAAVRGDTMHAAVHWRGALALWRGRSAYADVDDIDLVDAERTRLQELRTQAQEALADAEIALGRPHDAVAVLTEAIADQPYRERLRVLLMTALHRSGRRAEALEVFEETRARLDDDLGIEPSSELVALRDRVVNEDAALGVPLVEAEPATAGTSPRALPYDVPGFVGRTAALRQLDAALRGPRPAAMIGIVGGAAGIGKTALAVRWAHSVAAGFPDGQLFVDLRGYGPGAAARPADALAQLLRSLGVAPEFLPSDVDTAAALYRSLLAGRRMLVVLDDARTADQVRPLLPGTTGCTVVVTSRDRLSGLVAGQGAHRVTLDVLSDAEASHLLRAIAGSERFDADPVATRRLIDLCGGLPLALRIAAAHLADRPGEPLADYVAELSAADRVDALHVDGDEAAGLRSVLDRSFTAQKPVVRETLGLLAAVGLPDYAAELVAAATGQPLDQAATVLTELADGHLVEERANRRYAIHALVAAYAAARFGESPGPVTADEAMLRLLGYLRYAAVAAGGIVRSDLGPAPNLPRPHNPPELATAAAALDWLAAERHTLQFAIAHTPAAHVADLAQPLWQMYHARGYTAEWINAFEQALAQHATTTDADARFSLLNGLGNGYVQAGRYPEAITAHRECLANREAAGDALGAARARSNLAISYERQGRYEEALAELHRALAEVRALPHPRFEAFLLSSGLANVYFRSGRPRVAVDCLEQAMVIYAESDDPLDQARLALALSWAYDELAEPAPALRNARRALELAEEIGERRVAAQATAAIAAGLRLTGDLAGSLDARLRAGNMLRALGMGAADLENDLALAALHEQAGRLGVAADLYAAAATRAATMAARHQQAKALAGAGRTRRATDPDAAERFLLAAADLLDQVAPHEAAEIRSTLQPSGHAVP